MNGHNFFSKIVPAMGALLLVAITVVGIIGVLSLVAPTESTAGKLVLGVLLKDRPTDPPAQTKAQSETPQVWKEFAEAKAKGETHPLAVDLQAKLQAKFTQQPLYVDALQYKDLVIYDYKDVVTGQYWLFVYQYNPESKRWVFVEEVCQNCD